MLKQVCTAAISIVMVISPAAAAELTQQADELLDTMSDVWDTVPPCVTDGRYYKTRGVRLTRYGGDNYTIWFEQRVKYPGIDGSRDVGVDMMDVEKNFIIAPTQDQNGYTIRFTCRYTACVQPGNKTAGNLVVCAAKGEDPRATVDRLKAGLSMIWENVPRRPKPPF